MSGPASAVAPRAIDSLKKSVFWNYGGLYFFYFAIWQLAFTFLNLWLKNEGGMSAGSIGVVNTSIAVTALVLQPLYGYLQDRIGFKKYLFYFVVACAALMGPFFSFVFLPLIGFNEILAAVLGGMYLSLCLNAGVGIVEAFNERASRANDFEYGHARLFGSLAGATASLVGGFLWAANPQNIWWAASCSAIVLGALLYVARVPETVTSLSKDSVGADGTVTEVKEPGVSKETVLVLLRDRNFLGFVVLMFGTAALYDVFDQQFPIYFSSFVADGGGEVLFSRVVAVQIFLEAGFMLITPWIVNKIGARKGLLIFAGILVVRVVGSALFADTSMLIVWRLLAAVEMPLMLVSVMKYITRMFDIRISATAYMLGFNFAKQIGIAIFSTTFGKAYEHIGFAHSYLWMAGVIVVVTVIARIMMADDRDRVAPDERVELAPAEARG